MVRNLPIILGVLLIVGLTIPQIQMTDRLSGTNFSAEQRAQLLDKVPKSVGDWHGQDLPTDPNVRKTAGAIGAVSRKYRNSRTGEQVDLWLIVGHARNISLHTPDICYPASGFQARAAENSLYPMNFPGDTQGGTPFFTNTFLKEDVTGQHLVRVFWSWYNPDEKANQGKVVWDAPSNVRWHFGNARAVYKMYFTTLMRDPKETAEQSACIRFAKEFLPEVNKALSEVYNGPSGPTTGNAPAKIQTSPENTAAPPAKTEDAATEKAAPDTGKLPATPAAKASTETPAAAPAPGADPLFESPKADK